MAVGVCPARDRPCRWSSFGVAVACLLSTLRSVRSWSVPAGVMDELAFFRLEGSADSDAEIQASIRRGMLSFSSRGW